MLKRLVAALLIVCWIGLSGFDLVEDLNELHGQAAISQSSSGSSVPQRYGCGPLANNIVEFAYHVERNNRDLLNPSLIVTQSDWLVDFRRQSQLHKLHRVFLI